MGLGFQELFAQPKLTVKKHDLQKHPKNQKLQQAMEVPEVSSRHGVWSTLAKEVPMLGKKSRRPRCLDGICWFVSEGMRDFFFNLNIHGDFGVCFLSFWFGGHDFDRVYLIFDHMQL